jgi:signal transduction histidine kinase/ligand-binding sensor domain-containing protein
VECLLIPCDHKNSQFDETADDGAERCQDSEAQSFFLEECPKAPGSCLDVIAIGSLKCQATEIGLDFQFLENRSMSSAKHVWLSEQKSKRRNKRKSWLYLLILFLCIPLYGIDRDRKLDQLYHTGSTYAEGAPGEVNALAQTTDGYLWLGTATGLFRFDGTRFQPYKPQSGQSFPQRHVLSLFAVPDGGLWVGYRYGGVSFIKDGTVTDYGKREGLPSRAVLAFARDRQGAIWIAAGEDGLARLEGSRWKKIGTDWGFADPAVTVFVDHTGTLWVGTPTTVRCLVEGGNHLQLAAQGLSRVRNFAESSDGTLWVAELGYGVRPVPLPGKNKGKPEPAVLVGSQAITFDNRGSLWITSVGSGIRRVPYPEHLHPPKFKGPSAWQFHNSEVEAFTQQDGLTSDLVYCVLQDREGNVWFGTSGGLDRFRQSPVVSVPVQPISYRGALPIPSAHSYTTSALAAGEQGALWAAGIGPQVLLKIQNDKIVTQLRDRPVDSAYRDPNGAIWVATPYSIFRLADERLNALGSKQGAVTYSYDGASPAGPGLMLRQLHLPTAGGIAVSPHSRVTAITQDQLGRLWISMELGTFRLERSNWTSLESLGGPQGTATAEFTDSEGRIWFGFANAVAMLDGDRVRIFSGKDGVQVGGVTSIQGKETRIWIGGEFGLEFFDGVRFHRVIPSDGSAFGGVSGIVADPQSGLWFSENRGIINIREPQLRHPGSGKVEFESFSLLDGLTSQLRGSLASPSAVQTTDGRFWFATSRGVAWINPKRIVRNTVPPAVLIESVFANGRKYNASTSLRLPPRTTNLRIAYTATSLTVPERVRFRYKLEGQDKEWQDAGTRREVFYTNLDPGSYQFRVIACNNDGVWNEAGTVLQFDVLPAFYQTITFRILCGFALIVVLWLLHRLRIHMIEQRHLERDRAEEMVRQARAELAHIHRVSTVGELTASLAHEIKQPIGAAVTNAEACLRLIDRREPDLPEAREAALEMMRDARRAADIIEHVRSLFRKGSTSPEEIVDVNEVIREMVVMLQKEADRHSVRMSTELTDGPTKVMADRVQLQQVLMNLMLNGIEAMRDRTGELSIESQLWEDQVLISVSDTGVGIPTENADQIFDTFFTTKSQGTGLGLAITRSIVESHGGHIWATANSGPGATFQFTLPVREARAR